MDGYDATYKKPELSGPETLLLVLDCSSSMVDGNYQQCKQVIENAICPTPSITGAYPEGAIGDDVILGLREFGESSPYIQDPCKQTELVVKPGLANRAQVLDKLNHVSFGSTTPLTYAIWQLPADLSRARGPKHVILFTDGDGNCPNEDACNALEQVQRRTGAKIDIIGLRGANQGLLDCLNKLNNPNIHAQSANAENLSDIFGSMVRHNLEGKVLPRQSLYHRIKNKLSAFLHNEKHHCSCHKPGALNKVQSALPSSYPEGRQ
jgi:hypothetical protein